MRILGIDYGSKRVGLAVSDPEGRVAFPVAVLANTPELAAEIGKTAREYEAAEAVLGESRDYAGRPNAVFEAAEALKKSLEGRGLEVHMELEFMTSAQAERSEGKHPKLDASAAALILQSFLDRRNAEKA
ncbi:MAG: RuvX/YqgF family protein [Cyanobacteria bacterium REEB65]|nr:RuvX/YqgF family protein [Cyanobacteria bacterium REEB65]